MGKSYKDIYPKPKMDRMKMEGSKMEEMKEKKMSKLPSMHSLIHNKKGGTK